MKPNRPHKLFKYQAFSAQTLANLKQRVLYFAPAAVFNDPFDCQYSFGDYTPEDIERLIQRAEAAGRRVSEVRRELHDDPSKLQALLARSTEHARMVVSDSFNRVGVCCLSDRVDSLVMWGHYADGHRGFCLEFDTGSEHFERLNQVRYRQERPICRPADVHFNDGFHIVQSALCCKPEEWAYEREWRLIHEKAGTEYCYGTEALTGLYFGARMPFVHQELLALVVRGSRTQLYTTRLTEPRYAVAFEPCSYSPHPEAGGGNA